MEEKDIEALARKCAEEHYANFGDPYAISLMTKEYVGVIKCMLKTHNIVRK